MKDHVDFTVHTRLWGQQVADWESSAERDYSEGSNVLRRIVKEEIWDRGPNMGNIFVDLVHK